MPETAAQSCMLTWENKTPTEPGYYWMRDPRFENTEVIHEVYFDVTEGHLMVGQMNPTKVNNLHPWWEWAGPIPTPNDEMTTHD